MTDEDFKAEALSGASSSELAQLTGVSVSTVRRRRARLGCSARAGRPHAVDTATVKQLHSEGLSIPQIAEHLSAPVETVRDHVNGVTK